MTGWQRLSDSFICGVVRIRRASTNCILLGVVCLAPSLGLAANVDSYSRHATIEIGDSLWTIAVRQWGDGYCWPGLYWANPHIANQDVIGVGGRIDLPGECVRFPIPKLGGEGVYRVPVATTLAAVAAQFASTTDLTQLRRLNLHIDPGVTLPAGTLIYLKLPTEFQPKLIREATPPATTLDMDAKATPAPESPEPIGPKAMLLDAESLYATRLPTMEPRVKRAVSISSGVGAIGAFAAAIGFHVAANRTYERFNVAATRDEAERKEATTDRRDRLSVAFQWVGGGLLASTLTTAIWPARPAKATNGTANRGETNVGFGLARGRGAAVMISQGFR